MSIVAVEQEARKSLEAVDICEQLFNEGKHGRREEIQVSRERQTHLRGILFDLDPKLLRGSSLLPKVDQDPDEFFQNTVSHWLKRHPVLAKAEVRVSGSGLHAILWLDEPVSLETDSARQHWDATVKIVQASLPIDPEQPGILATTRVLGGINSKNNATVRQLQPGERVSVAEVESLAEEMCAKPFATVLRILTGQERINPCPLCRDANNELSALDHFGKCYGSCGRVTLDQLYDLLYLPRSPKSKGAKHD